MYAEVSDLRNEGITDVQATDDRLVSLVQEASRAIDKATGWFFEPRELGKYLQIYQ